MADWIDAYFELFNEIDGLCECTYHRIIFSDNLVVGSNNICCGPLKCELEFGKTIRLREVIGILQDDVFAAGQSDAFVLGRGRSCVILGNDPDSGISARIGIQDLRCLVC